MTLKRVLLFAGFLTLGAVMGALPAFATDPAPYWISLRGIRADPAPVFVVAKMAAAGGYTTPFQGCRSRTYYVLSADAVRIQTARAAGHTIQIHGGAPGSSPQNASVICLIQAER